MIILKRSLTTKQDYFSLTQTVQHMKSKPKMYIETFRMIKTNLIIAIIQKTLHILIKQIRKIQRRGF